MRGPLHIRGTVLPDGEPADWWVRDGLLSAEPVPGAETVFTDGWIMPGLVDAHCHVGLGPHGETPIEQAVAQAEAERAAGALLLRDPSALENPFYRMFPDAWLLPAVVLATVSTVIASQAVISGAYSMTKQAMQLGLLPRMQVMYTSSKEAGQIYMPGVNWVLLAAVLAAVFGFGSSSAMANAYGIAVTGTMVIDTLLVGIVMSRMWNWHQKITIPLTEIDHFLINTCEC